MKSVEFAENFVKGTMQRNKDGMEYAFVIIENNQVIGRIGVYKIDNQNRLGEIGYWIIERVQGKGIVTKICKTIIDFCFKDLELNRIEIKCGTANIKSKKIPEKLNFSREGIIRQGELLYDKFIDLNLYSLLRVHTKMSQQQVVCVSTNHGTASVGVRTDRNKGATIWNAPLLKLEQNK